MSTIEMSASGRAQVDKLAGRAFADDGQRVEWLAQRATQLAELEPELKQVHADLRELAAAHAAGEPEGGTRLRFTGEQFAQLEKIMGRRLERGENIGAALMEWAAETSRKLEQGKARLHAAEMQATGRRLAAERREREAAEEETYPDDFKRRFGAASRLSAPPATEDEAERRRIADFLGIDPSRVL